jgi:hypothetical protein
MNGLDLDDRSRTIEPLRISMRPVTSHTRTPVGIGIIAASTSATSATDTQGAKLSAMIRCF